MIDRKTANALQIISDLCFKQPYCNGCPLGGYTSDDMCLMDWSPRDWIIKETETGKYEVDIL